MNTRSGQPGGPAEGRLLYEGRGRQKYPGSCCPDAQRAVWETLSYTQTRTGETKVLAGSLGQLRSSILKVP